MEYSSSRWNLKMSPIEGEILVTILKKTRNHCCTKMEDISREAHVPSELTLEALDKFHKEDLLEIRNDEIIINEEQRLKIAVKAVSLGLNIERIARSLTWSEFEKISKIAFEANGFTVKMNFHFTWQKKRWEIDIIGLKKPIVISADCKRWCQKWSGAASIKAVENQIKRTRALAEASRNITSKIGINGWEYAYFIPIVLSLLQSQHKFYEGTPIVPIFQLKDFLQNIMVYINDVNRFYVSYAVQKSLDEFKK